ncbi:MAG: hypothetical protein DRJ51_08995, partial [Thermoprotei archaeon]
MNSLRKFSLIAILIALVVSIAAPILSLATLAQQFPLTITKVEPQEVTVGTTVKIEGTAAPGARVDVRFGSISDYLIDPTLGGTLVASIYAGFDGTWRTTFTVPEVPYPEEVYVVWAVSGYVYSDPVELYFRPKIEVTPSTVKPDDPITVKGYGFLANDVVNVTVVATIAGEKVVTAYTEVTAADDGTFIATIPDVSALVPSIPRGTIEVWANSTINPDVYASALISVVPAIYVQVGGLTGTSITVSGEDVAMLETPCEAGGWPLLIYGKGFDANEYITRVALEHVSPPGIQPFIVELNTSITWKNLTSGVVKKYDAETDEYGAFAIAVCAFLNYSELPPNSGVVTETPTTNITVTKYLLEFGGIHHYLTTYLLPPDYAEPAGIPGGTYDVLVEQTGAGTFRFRGALTVLNYVRVTPAPPESIVAGQHIRLTGYGFLPGISDELTVIFYLDGVTPLTEISIPEDVLPYVADRQVITTHPKYGLTGILPSYSGLFDILIKTPEEIAKGGHRIDVQQWIEEKCWCTFVSFVVGPAALGEVVETYENTVCAEPEKVIVNENGVVIGCKTVPHLAIYCDVGYRCSCDTEEVLLPVPAGWPNLGTKVRIFGYGLTPGNKVYVYLHEWEDVDLKAAYSWYFSTYGTDPAVMADIYGLLLAITDVGNDTRFSVEFWLPTLPGGTYYFKVVEKTPAGDIVSEYKVMDRAAPEEKFAVEVKPGILFKPSVFVGPAVTEIIGSGFKQGGVQVISVLIDATGDGVYSDAIAGVNQQILSDIWTSGLNGTLTMAFEVPGVPLRPGLFMPVLESGIYNIRLVLRTAEGYEATVPFPIAILNKISRMVS